MMHTHPIRHRGLARAGLTALTALAVAGATLTAPMGAQAAVGPPGPLDPGNGFPKFYSDASGNTALQLCLDGTVACANTTPSDLTAPDGEAFYYSAAADIPVDGGVVTVAFALEAAFAGPGAGQQIVFDRIRVRGEVPAGDYVLQHPFGEEPLRSDVLPGFNLNFTDDQGCADVPCDFTRARTGRITNFLRSTSAPLGYLGDGDLPSTVTGATASDAGVERDLVRLLDSSGNVVGQTDQFVVLGKLIDGPSAALSASSVDFGNTASASQPVTVTNVGTQNLTFTGAPTGLSGGFAVGANGCTGSLAPGGSCTVTVTFASTTLARDARATLSLPTNTPTGAVTVPLHATALPAVSVSGGPLTFGAQKVGTTGAARGVTVTNTGVVALPAVTAATTGPFTAPTGCAAPLAPGASCTVATSYLPTAHGAQSGTLTVSHPAAANATSSTVSLSGSGTTPVAAVNLGSLDFGRAKVRTTTPQRVVRLSNTGDAAMVVGSASTTGPFKVSSSDCPASLAPGDFCTVSVTFRPTALGEAAGSLLLGHDAASGPRAVPLQGTGSRAAAPSAPRRVVAHSGRAGGRVTASVSWLAPRSNGGAGIRSYRVSVRRVGSSKVRTVVVRASARSRTVTHLVRGARYRFAVRAVNGVGPSVASPFSSAVRAR